MPGSKNIAVIGLGSMGLGMAQSLLRAGHAVTGCDISADARNRLKASGGHAVRTPAEAAGHAEIVVVVVVNAAQTETALFGDGGAAAAMPSGSVLISCATIPPVKARTFATRIEESGLLYLDAPISGGAAKAADGKLTIMASGPPASFAAARPALAAMAETVFELGDDIGTGSSFKIVNQLLAGVHIAAACEAIVFAKALGLDIERVFKVICQSAGNSWMFENRVPHILEGDYAPKSSVSIFTKDLGIVGELGLEKKLPLTLSSAALQLFLMTEGSGMGRDDDASVARFLATLAGIELPGAPSDK